MSKVFNSFFGSDTIVEIPYNRGWASRAGYFNHAVRGECAPDLVVGEIVKSTSIDGRKILIVGTPAGNAVMFQRYTHDESVFLSNIPSSIKKLFLGILDSGRLSEEAMYTLLGDVRFQSLHPNIGQKLKYFQDNLNLI